IEIVHAGKLEVVLILRCHGGKLDDSSWKCHAFVAFESARIENLYLCKTRACRDNFSLNIAVIHEEQGPLFHGTKDSRWREKNLARIFNFFYQRDARTCFDRKAGVW